MAIWTGKPMKDPGRYIDIIKLANLMESCANSRDRLLILMLFRTGRRVSELLRLQPEHINFEEKTIQWTILKKKTPTQRRKPVDAITLKALADYIENNQIKEGEKIFKITRQWTWKIVSRLSAKTGIVCENGHLLTPHVGRHSYAIHLAKEAESPYDIKLITQLLDHSNESMTWQYIDIPAKKARQLVEKSFEKEE